MTLKVVGDSSLEQTWIFGFGSLVYKAGFEYTKRVEGYIKGYRRVFYQGSTDHRGVPGAPGRVVTLERNPGGRCWGAAYLLAGNYEQQQKTLAYLEWREKQYDVRARVDVFGRESECEPVVRGALTYIASEDQTRNLNYLGTAPREAIAQQIAVAVGPSGHNYEYLFRLADAMQEMGAHDEDLIWLAARVREIRARLEDSDGDAAAGSSAMQTGDGGSAEEAEKDLQLTAARVGAVAVPEADAFVGWHLQGDDVDGKLVQ